MQKDSPKKKKKYVPAGTSKLNSNIKSQNSSYVQVQKVQDKPLDRCKFEYGFQEIINHILARLLPDSNFIVKLDDNLIYGEPKIVDSLIAKLNKNIKYTTCVTIELNEGKTNEDIDYQMKQQFHGETYNAKIIQMFIKDFFKDTKWQKEYINFLNQFKQNNRLYVRLNKTFLPDFLSAIEEQGAIVLNENERERPRRGNRTRFKNVIDSYEINADKIDIGEMKKFFSRSDKLQLQDIEVQAIKNQSKENVRYKIQLKCYEECSQTKLSAFRYYLRHEDFVNIPLKQSKHKDELIEEYSQINQNYLKVRYIKGYKSSKWDDKNLLYKIRMDQISKKKTNFTNQFFQAFHLIGMLPTVRQYIEELQLRLNQVPMDDITQQIFIQFDQKLKDYIRSNKKVQSYIKNFILTYMKQFDRICEVQSVKFPLRSVKLNLKIKNDQQQNFKLIEHSIAYSMPKNIQCQKVNVDFAIDEQLLEKLESSEILVVQKEEKNFTFISKGEDVPVMMEKVQKILDQLKSVGQQSLTVLGFMKKVRYMQEINKLRQKKEQFKDIMIPDPISDDNMKFKIMFYGPKKKNDAFFQQVKRTIQKRQSQLGQYCESVDSREADIIAKDKQFQQKLQELYKISLMINHFQEQARLQVGRSEIHMIKDKNFDRVPLGYWIYLNSRQIILDLKSKYLQKFKIKVKRFKKDQWLDNQQQSNRSYLFLYRQNFQLQDMLTNALGQNRSSQDDPYYLALFMPAVKKDLWMEQLLTCLTSHRIFGGLRYNILIIERDSDENVAKVVNLPQHTAFNSQIDQFEVEWYCQKIKYGQSATTKINDAVANRQSDIILGKQDIPVDEATHICDLEENILYFWKNNKKQISQKIPIKILNQKILFDYNGYTFILPVSEFNKVIYNKMMGKTKFLLSIPFYKIDLIKMQQINIFTGFKRSITKKQIKIQNKHKFDGNVKAFYNEQITQLIYTFKEEDQKNLNSAATDVSKYRKQLWKREEIDIQEIKMQNFRNLLRERIQARAQQCGLKYTLDANIKKIVVQSLNEKDIDKFKTLIDNQSKYLVRLSENSLKKVIDQIKYPQYWQPQQKQIQAFEVGKNTAEFIEIQNLFAIKPIHSLLRIQNKIIYRKYKEQVQHLSFMNNNKQPKQMRLFHGTGKTSPQVIWSDNEDGFNINYSSNNNLLGRGIYFAQKADYSFHYAYKEKEGGFMDLRGMFLCQVIVGDSQNMNMSSENNNVIATKQKPNGVRYESMKGVHSICDIYVVYRNKRAYPLYFIKFQG